VLRAVISLLVALPLLLPPGVCACRLALAAAAPPSPDSVDICRTPQHACCAHRKNAARHNVDRRTASANSTSLRESQGPAPGKTHEPGCPALLTADHSKLSERTNTTSPILTVSQDGVRAVDADITGPASAVASQAVAPSSRPLYLSFRSLLI